jgi:flagellar basal body-associated protein FliL
MVVVVVLLLLLLLLLMVVVVLLLLSGMATPLFVFLEVCPLAERPWASTSVLRACSHLRCHFAGSLATFTKSETKSSRVSARHHSRRGLSLPLVHA